MQRVVALLRRSANGRAFEELAAALVVMADVDKRRRGLRDAIIRSLNEETLMESWLYKQGEEKGFKKGEEKGLEKGLEKGAARSLRALFLRRIGREPTPDEEQAVTRRAHDVSPEQLVELFEMPADALLTWLAAR